MFFLIALGANLSLGENHPANTLQSALDRLSACEIAVEAVSPFYQTPCFPAGAGPDYVNAAARLRCDLSPQELLTVLHAIEAEFGREREVRWGMRTLDLDLIAAEDIVLPDPETYSRWRTLPPSEQTRQAPDQLILPHPRLQDRGFVLVPLRDIAAQWWHPVLNRTIEDMCDALSPADLAEIVALDA